MMAKVLRENVKDSLELIGEILDQITSVEDDDYAGKVYDDLQTIVNDLVLLYGMQELNKKFKEDEA